MDRPPPSGLPPARPPSSKPTSARELAGAAPPAAPDPGHAVVEVGGTAWTARVLGRAGRASGASAPLLLIGFWDDSTPVDRPHSREALVVARAIEDLPAGALEEALASGSSPRDPERAPGFFQESAQGARRRRANENI